MAIAELSNLQWLYLIHFGEIREKSVDALFL
jgi:hypothetical protein